MKKNVLLALQQEQYRWLTNTHVLEMLHQKMR